MLDFRCSRCSKLLARTAVAERIEIKCPRCGAFNILRAKSPESERLGVPDRSAHEEAKQKIYSPPGRCLVHSPQSAER
ncbi:Com family DNA-binding transcriptional regulator [Microbulbifer sp. 2201CG32-9]|uniref:Com family DNA-binding transcriptional regulator n=1 Tax=Microbulbifer sp. 2201CG32-9 TaxID=3232309 RepID=UPI00345BDEF3